MSKDTVNYGDYLPSESNDSSNPQTNSQSSSPVVTAANIGEIIKPVADIISSGFKYGEACQQTKAVEIKARVDHAEIDAGRDGKLSDERIKQSEIAQKDRESERYYRLEEQKLQKDSDAFSLDIQKHKSEMQKYLIDKEYAKDELSNKFALERDKQLSEDDRNRVKERQVDEILTMLREGTIVDAQFANELINSIKQ